MAHKMIATRTPIRLLGSVCGRIARSCCPHFEVKPGYGDHVSRPVTSLIYTPGQLRICDKVLDWAQYEKTPTSQPKRDADGRFVRRIDEIATERGSCS